MKKSYILLVLVLFALFAASVSSVAAQTMSDDTNRLKGLRGKDFDVAFMKLMIGHHEGAVAMVKYAPTNASHAEIKQLATNITAAQNTEISQMKGWLKDWYNEQPDPEMGGMVDHKRGMPEMNMGSMDEMVNQIIELIDAKGDDYDQKLLTYMIPHHQSAIEMAALVVERSDRAELKTLAQGISASQRGEISQMQGWLQAWYGVTLPANPTAAQVAEAAPTAIIRSADDVARPAVSPTTGPTSTTRSVGNDSLPLWLLGGVGLLLAVVVASYFMRRPTRS